MSKAGFFDDIFDVPSNDPLLQPEGDGDPGGTAQTGQVDSRSSSASGDSTRRLTGDRRFPSRGRPIARTTRDSDVGKEGPVKRSTRKGSDNLPGNRETASRDGTGTERKRIEVAPRLGTGRCDLDTVNRALRQDWRLHDIRPFRFDDQAEPVLVVTLERDLPRSLFDFGGAG